MYFYPESILRDIEDCKKHLYYLQTAELTTQVGYNFKSIALSEAEYEIFSEMRKKLIELTEKQLRDLELKAEKFRRERP